VVLPINVIFKDDGICYHCYYYNINLPARVIVLPLRRFLRSVIKIVNLMRRRLKVTHVRNVPLNFDKTAAAAAAAAVVGEGGTVLKLCGNRAAS